MSRNDKLDKRVMSICGTIYLWSMDRFELHSKLLEFCKTSDYITHYYFIFHDDEENQLHFHYILRCNRSIRLSTMLNNLEVGLGIDRNQISVEVLRNLNYYLRYFLHVEEEDKKQYFISAIVSDESTALLESYINTDDFEITTERLIAYIVNSNTIDELMIRMGLKSFHKYRYEIKELWETRGSLSVRYKYLISGANDLPF